MSDYSGDLETAGGYVGGAVGNGMQAVGEGIDAYNNYESGNYGTAIYNAGSAIYDGVTAYGEGCAGDWVDPSL
jgi:hypothetical protein